MSRAMYPGWDSNPDLPLSQNGALSLELPGHMRIIQKMRAVDLQSNVICVTIPSLLRQWSTLCSQHPTTDEGKGCEVNDDLFWVQIVASLLVVLLLGGFFYFIGLELEQERLQQEETRQQLGIQHPDWPWALIDEGEIKLGMTDEMVRASWGDPDDINRSVGSWGVHEQWVYPRSSYDDDYLYFENGILTSWQT